MAIQNVLAIFEEVHRTIDDHLPRAWNAQNLLAALIGPDKGHAPVE